MVSREFEVGFVVRVLVVVGAEAEEVRALPLIFQILPCHSTVVVRVLRVLVALELAFVRVSQLLQSKWAVHLRLLVYRKQA